MSRQNLLQWGTFAAFACFFFWVLFYPNHFTYPVQGDCVLTLQRADYQEGYFPKFALRAYLEQTLRGIYHLCGNDLVSVARVFTGVFFVACALVFGLLRRLYGFGPALLGASLFCVYSSKFEVFFIFSGDLYHFNILIGAFVIWLGVRAAPTVWTSVVISVLIFLSSHLYENLIVLAPFFALVWLGEPLLARQWPSRRTWVACALPFLAALVIFLFRSDFGRGSVIRGDVGPSSPYYGLSLAGKLAFGVKQTLDATLGARHADQSGDGARFFFENLTAKAPALPWLVFGAGLALLLSAVFAPRSAPTPEPGSRVRPQLVGLAALIMLFVSGVTTMALNGTFAPSRLTYLPSLFLVLAVAAFFWAVSTFLARWLNERNVRLALALPVVGLVCFELMAFSAIARSAGDTARLDAAITRDLQQILPAALPPQGHFLFFMQLPEPARHGYWKFFPCTYESRPQVPLWYAFKSNVIPQLTTSLRIESVYARSARLEPPALPLEAFGAAELARLFEPNLTITGGTATPVTTPADPEWVRMENTFPLIDGIKVGLGELTRGANVRRNGPGVHLFDESDTDIGELAIPLTIEPSPHPHCIEMALQASTEAPACVRLRLDAASNLHLLDVWFDPATGHIEQAWGQGAQAVREGEHWRLVLPFDAVSPDPNLQFSIAPAAGRVLGQPDPTLKGGIELSRVTVRLISPFMPFVLDENNHPRFIESVTFTDEAKGVTRAYRFAPRGQSLQGSVALAFPAALLPAFAP